MKRHFTLLEMSIVIAVMIMVLFLVISTFSSSKQELLLRAKCQNQLLTTHKNLSFYSEDFSGILYLRTSDYSPWAAKMIYRGYIPDDYKLISCPGQPSSWESSFKRHKLLKEEVFSAQVGQKDIDEFVFLTALSYDTYGLIDPDLCSKEFLNEKKAISNYTSSKPSGDELFIVGLDFKAITSPQNFIYLSDTAVGSRRGGEFASAPKSNYWRFGNAFLSDEAPDMAGGLGFDHGDYNLHVTADGSCRIVNADELAMLPMPIKTWVNTDRSVR